MTRGTKVTIDGFGPGDEAELVWGQPESASATLMFNFFPPSWADDELRVNLGQFGQFDQEPAQLLGCEVQWEDRELFVLVAPPADAAERINAFLRTYPRAPRT